MKVGLNEFRATNDIGYLYATADKLLTPTNDMQFWVWLAVAEPLEDRRVPWAPQIFFFNILNNLKILK